MWRIAVCCADSEIEYAEQLEQHLSPLVRSGRSIVWHRGKITAGGTVADVVKKQLDTADCIVLLVTSKLLAMAADLVDQALAQRTRGAVVLPVLVRATYLESGPLAGLRYLPKDGQPLKARRNEDSAWVEVAESIQTMAGASANAPSVPAMTVAPQASGSAVAPATIATPAAQPRIKILFCGTIPANAGSLDLGREVREVGRRIDYAQQRTRLELVQEWAVSAAELSQILLRHQPTILHISGHATPDGRIVLLSEDGSGYPVPAAALARLVSLLVGKGLRCVVLNSCFAEDLARALAQHVEIVIGMSGAVEDSSSLSFSAGFYAGLAAGTSVKEAFELGCIQIEILGQSQSDVPRLCPRAGVDPAATRL